jgi:proton-dependent oligopeptide transporter, POT family
MKRISVVTSSTTRSFGFPRGAWLIIIVEFWERFSFYGMLAILALFLTAEPARGGFGWTDGRALTLVGIYTGLMYALPAFGGYVADRVLGRRRAVMIGAALMLVGQSLMASPVYIPWLLGAWRGLPLLAALRQLHVPLGYLARPDAVNVAIAAHGWLLDHQDGVKWLSEAYGGATLGLYAALGCLILGNALMKSTMVVLCGDAFAAGDTRREAAYAYYYLGIAVGSFLSGIVVGSVAEVFGWHYGFSVGAVGMVIALTAYRVLAPRWLGEIGTRPEPSPGKSGAGANRARHTKMRLTLLLILALLLCVFSTGWFQMYGSWSLYIDRFVDRAIGGFIVPVPWFASWNSLIVVASAPLFAALWVRLAARHQRIDIVHKYSFALATVAGGHFLMYGAVVLTAQGGLAPLWIPLFAFALCAIGEIVAWTSTYDIIYRAAPRGFVSATMGAWYFMTLGLGGYLSGVTGKWVESLGYGNTFLVLAVAFGAIAIVALVARAPLRRLASRSEVTL